MSWPHLPPSLALHAIVEMAPSSALVIRNIDGCYYLAVDDVVQVDDDALHRFSSEFAELAVARRCRWRQMPLPFGSILVFIPC